MFSITELTNKYRNRSLTPTQHITNELRKLESLRKTQINAVSQYIDHTYILQQAAASTERYKKGKPLSEMDGVPITIKDTDTNWAKGIPVHNGSLLPSKNILPSKSAPHIDILLQNGAIILCQTTAPEVSYKGTTSSIANGITRNPHNLQLTVGGSSGGAGALCAAGINGIHLGSDGGGSIRIPASCCGVVGFKPTYPIGSSSGGAKFPWLSHVGPLTQYVDDCRIYMKMLTQKKYELFLAENGGAKSNFIKTDYQKLNAMNFSAQYMKKGVSGLRIAVSKTFDGLLQEDSLDKRIWNKLLESLKIFEKLGAKIDFVEPNISAVSMPYYEWFMVMWAATMHYYYGPYVNDNNKHLVDPGLYAFMETAKNISMETFIKCLNTRDELCGIMNKFMDKYDLLITPTLPVLPPKAMAYDKEIEVIDSLRLFPRYTCLFNLTHQPAISVNCGYENGVPIGMQIVGGLWKDDLVLRAAYTFQQHMKPKIAKL